MVYSIWYRLYGVLVHSIVRHTDIKILHSGSKAQNKEGFQKPWLFDPYEYLVFWAVICNCLVKGVERTRIRSPHKGTIGSTLEYLAAHGTCYSICLVSVLINPYRVLK